MLDAALRATFRNLSTLFLVVAVVTVPLHVGHALLFRDVAAMDEIQGDLEDLPTSVVVRGVGAGDLAAARRALVIVSVIELALVPLLYRATRRVLRDDVAGEVPTAWRAWLGAPRPINDRRAKRAGWPTALGGLAVAGLVWLLARTAGLLIAELLPDRFDYVLRALSEGAARALALPFLLVPAVFWLRGAKGMGGSEPTT